MRRWNDLSMMHLPAAAALVLALVPATPAAAEGRFEKTFAVNDYFAMAYENEPVSFDVRFEQPVAKDQIGLDAGPWQVEVLEGSEDAVEKARVWTLVSFPFIPDEEDPERLRPGTGEDRHKLIRVVAPVERENAPSAVSVEPAEPVGGVPTAIVDTGTFRARVPVGGGEFDRPQPAFDVPGPVIAVSQDGEKWVGSGYLDSMQRVVGIECRTEHGPVYFESKLTYHFGNGGTYTVRLRFYTGKPYVQLAEDFDVGGNTRFIFNFEDWAAEDFFFPRDQRLVDWQQIEGASNPANDFIEIEGQTALARMVIWSQFNYFRGKQETIALRSEDGLAVGGFYIRPDLWTRAKINHVDLYKRPQVPGDRLSRGVVGLEGSEDRIAMEAWLNEGHRRWAIFAVDGDDSNFFAKAHVQEGVWPLDRLNRLPLVWNSDGSPVAPEDTMPGDRPVGGTAAVVLKNTGGRSGLQYFNGSNPHIRRTSPRTEPWADSPVEVTAGPDQNNDLVLRAMRAYMGMDDSAYPSVRAMLPWTDPEAINPFYQGMENQNFNADLYRYVATHGVELARRNHPEAMRFIEHAEVSFDMALDTYVYPQSGCWEESHTYANHTLRTVMPLVDALAANDRRNFYDDPRFARMLEFFIYVYSPHDEQFGGRVVPPVGDHGLSTAGPADRLGRWLDRFARSDNPEVQDIIGRVAWMVAEDDGEVPEGIEPRPVELTSRWLQGYGTVMRGFRPVDEGPPQETFLVLRSGQSWGHHHQDKGRMWFWGRDVHFFGGAAWGSPPGGTYWNDYKQGPAGGTQIEFVGVNNWPLPCKYPAGWISDDEYAEGYDYANARNLFPYNPELDLSRSSPVALTNGYDRQVLLVHPDVLIVRDNVETTCETVWRMHSYQPDGLEAREGGATMTSPEGVVGELVMAYPDDISFDLFDRDNKNDHVHEDDEGNPLPYEQRPRFGREEPVDTRSVAMRWRMPTHTSATWVFSVRDADEAVADIERLDDDGRILRITLADGTRILSLLNRDRFTFEGEGIVFEGTVGLVIHRPGVEPELHPIRAARLERQ